MAESSDDKVAPIAVVGLGCRFPGSATSDSSLWQMLVNGESAWSEIPDDRMDITSYYHPDNARQGSIPFRGGHFLQQDVSAFDNSFFSISTEEAKAIDPQQRMLLEVAVESLDSAGIDRSVLRDSETGVWIGSFVKDYEQVVLRDPDNAPKYGATGNGIAIMSNRLSFFLDVHGPSMTIDTGCSASLVCVHNAAQSLRDGEIDVALAGGAGLILTPATMMPMTALNFLSPDGRCYTFDSRANGYGRGEGIGIVVLKRLEDAIRDNDNIRAVIRGSRVNQDGRTAGITLPSSEAQINNIRGVYKRAGLGFDKTAFVECHGTGTKAGDWREVKAVSESLCAQRSGENPIYVGSLKTNIGHLEGCAGIAGLIKGVLAIENGVIPKHLNFETPNPDIDFEASRVKVPTENVPWPMEGLRRASINCFGFGGTNAHVILDDAAHYLAARSLSGHHNTKLLGDSKDPSASLRSITNGTSTYADGLSVPPPNDNTHLFVMSANDKQSLERLIQNLISYLQGKDSSSLDIMQDLSYTLGCRRTKLQWRTAVVASSPEELIHKMSQVGQTDISRTSEEKSTKVTLVFGGQGAQWFAMGRELLGFKTFLKVIVEATKYLKEELNSPFNLLEELLKDKSTSRIDDPEIAQPATTALQVALVDLLIDYLGVVPVSVCGHSSGEIAAAYAAGAISKEHALQLAYYRGHCAANLRKSQEELGQTSRTPGRMLAVGLSAEDVQPYVEAAGTHRVTVACINSPASVTLSGDNDAVVGIHETLDAAGVFNRLLTVTTAYHSHHMKECESMYMDSIAHISPRCPVRVTVPHQLKGGDDSTRRPKRLEGEQLPVMYSSVTGEAVKWDELVPEYWVKNMVSPVLFKQALSNLVSDPAQRPDIIVEVGPHSTLQGPIKQTIDANGKIKQQPAYFSLFTRNKDAIGTALSSIGNLWSRGCPVAMEWVAWRNVTGRRPKLLVDMPLYPWNHSKSHWHESHLSKANRFQKHGRYDLIGRPTADSIPSQPRWRGFLRLSENPWIRHHQVQKAVIYPAAGMIAMVIEGAKQLAESDFSGVEITQFRIHKAMIIPSTAHGLEFALNMSKHSDYHGEHSVHDAGSSTYHFYIYSKPFDGTWQEHGDGIVTIVAKPPAEGIARERQVREDLIKAEKHRGTCRRAMAFCDEVVIPRQLYETLDVIGMNYGPLFQNISSLRKRDEECIGTIRIPNTKSSMPSQFEYPHIIHPATLDSIFHTAFALGSEPMVPSFIKSVYVANNSLLSTQGHDLLVHTKAKRRQLRDASAKFMVSDNSLDCPLENACEPLIVVKDMTFTALTANPADVEGGFLPSHRNLCSEMKWESAPVAEDTSATIQESLDETTPVLILVPSTTSFGLRKLISTLCEKLNGIPRTLEDISTSTESLPELCISLLEADGDHFMWNLSEQEFSGFHSISVKTKSMFWVTRGSQMEVSDPKAALFQALARTLHSEYPEKNFVTLDISEDTSFETQQIGDLHDRIVSLFREAFLVSSNAAFKEAEYAVRDGQTMIPRLVPIEPLNAIIERGTTISEPELRPFGEHRDRSLKLKIHDIKDLDSLYWDDDQSATDALSPNEVRVRVLSSSISALDVDIVMGRANSTSIGTDLYGVVEELGSEVLHLAIGDHVLGVARGSLRELVKCDQALLYKCSTGKAFPHHAFLPTPYAVAHYSFGERLREGESILIHIGASDFGQAAIQLAKSIGATIFATVTDEGQRAVLRGCYGIPDSHIINASSGSWVDVIMRMTDYKGVRVVYDPTVDDEDFEPTGLADWGTLIKFTRKRHISALINTADQGFNFMALDLSRLIESEPHRLGKSFAAVCEKYFHNEFAVAEPFPLKAFDYSKLPSAFRTAIDNAHRGHVYCFRPEGDKPVPILPRPVHPASEFLRDDATYVLSGGLGGLGIEIAKLLATNGAKYIAFIARSGVKNELGRSCIEFLEHRGVRVLVLTTDICNREAVEEAERAIANNKMPPVKGVFQCAATVRDAVFENMTYEAWQTAVRPKTIGSWNLKEVFASQDKGHLDFFIFLSSSAGVIGSRGQANYAVGNAFQDALAIHINGAFPATHAVSIDLGPVLGAGMLAEDPRTLDMLKASGFFGIRLEDFRRLIERAIAGHTDYEHRMPAQVVIGVGTGGLIRQNKPADPYWTRTAMFAHLNKVDMPEEAELGSTEGGADGDMNFPRMLKDAADPEDATAIVSTGLRTMLSKSMNIGVDDVDENRSPGAYGVDSLVAVGVRNWVHRECRVDVSVFEVLSDQSILELSALIVEKGGYGA